MALRSPLGSMSLREDIIVAAVAGGCEFLCKEQLKKSEYSTNQNALE